MKDCINCLLAAYPSDQGMCQEHTKEAIRKGLTEIKAIINQQTND